MTNPFWTRSLPLWVSREYEHAGVKEQSQLAVPGWLLLLLGGLGIMNAVMWGILGIILALVEVTHLLAGLF